MCVCVCVCVCVFVCVGLIACYLETSTMSRHRPELVCHATEKETGRNGSLNDAASSVTQITERRMYQN